MARLQSRARIGWHAPDTQSSALGETAAEQPHVSAAVVRYESIRRPFVHQTHTAQMLATFVQRNITSKVDRNLKETFLPKYLFEHPANRGQNAVWSWSRNGKTRLVLLSADIIGVFWIHRNTLEVNADAVDSGQQFYQKNKIAGHNRFYSHISNLPNQNHQKKHNHSANWTSSHTSTHTHTMENCIPVHVNVWWYDNIESLIVFYTFHLVHNYNWFAHTGKHQARLKIRAKYFQCILVLNKCRFVLSLSVCFSDLRCLTGQKIELQ